MQKYEFSCHLVFGDVGGSRFAKRTHPSTMTFTPFIIISNNMKSENWKCVIRTTKYRRNHVCETNDLLSVWVFSMASYWTAYTKGEGFMNDPAVHHQDVIKMVWIWFCGGALFIYCLVMIVKIIQRSPTRVIFSKTNRKKSNVLCFTSMKVWPKFSGFPYRD